jgi:hypothetical protein
VSVSDLHPLLSQTPDLSTHPEQRSRDKLHGRDPITEVQQLYLRVLTDMTMNLGRRVLEQPFPLAGLMSSYLFVYLNFTGPAPIDNMKPL